MAENFAQVARKGPTNSRMKKQYETVPEKNNKRSPDCRLIWRLTALSIAVQLTSASAMAHLPDLEPGNNNNLTGGGVDSSAPNENLKQAAGESMKFPLYMRIIATIACLLIFSVGVCGNLLVPLVVIKTKYLRNSTNLFLINLSMADLLVLTVCMPTVLIELHSRPETWLLGEPMCKLSNYVEMLAANGSIFTILAISFERYYAICEPLKAGYKCTRLRAIVIICAIWLLASLLTSPILIMAKFAQTVYIDGSLVYNCILETDTYWAKFYVHASMFAFFCLPLIVLMLVYWLIGRRLIRENIAMSTTTSLATADSIETSQTSTGYLASNANGCGGGHRQRNCSIHSTNGIKAQSRLSKAASLKSISAFFSSLHHYHNINSPADSAKETAAASITSDGVESGSRSQVAGISTDFKRRMLPGNKAVSLDHHNLMIDKENACSPTDPLNGKIIELDAERQIGSHFRCKQSVANRLGSCLKRSLANKFVYQLLQFKSNGRSDEKDSDNKNKQTSECIINGSENRRQTSSDGRNPTIRCIDDNDRSSREPFLDISSLKNQPFCVVASKKNRDLIQGTSETKPSNGRFMFSWAKQFSVSSSSTSTHTNCTGLPLESSTSGQEIQPDVAGIIHQSPGFMIRDDSSNSGTNSSARRQHLVRNRRRIAHFSTSPGRNSSIIQSSSASESCESPYSTSKSPSPDSMVINEEKITFNLEDHNAGADEGKDVTLISSELSPQSKHSDLARIDGSSNDFKSETSTQEPSDSINPQSSNCDNQASTRHVKSNQKGDKVSIVIEGKSEKSRVKLATMKGKSLDSHHYYFPFNLRRYRDNNRHKASICSCNQFQSKARLSELLVVQDLSKKQQMDSRRQVVVMLAFVVTCFFLLFLPYRVFTIWLILSTEDQVQSLGMETYYNLTYFSRILIYLHSAINPIAYNLISTKFRRAFMSILLCRGSSSRRHFTTEHRITNNNKKTQNYDGRMSITAQKRQSHR